MMPMMVCYLGVGSNLGLRRNNIKQAIRKINFLKDTRVLKQSKVIETEPVSGPINQPKFLNACLKINTSLPAVKLLKELKTIESDLGRVKTVACGPRTIDLDILLYGDKIIKSKKLTIPHPRMFKRQFVLKPLLEVLC